MVGRIASVCSSLWPLIVVVLVACRAEGTEPHSGCGEAGGAELRPPTNAAGRSVDNAGQNAIEVSWRDESDGETCYVLETKVQGRTVEVTVLPANSGRFFDPGPFDDVNSVEYHIYAATSDERSEEAAALVVFPIP